jgi:hypothetical protein
MSIDALSGAAGARIDHFQRPPGSPQMQQAMAPTAELLGMTTEELQEQLRSGATLASLADAKGVAQADLIGSIEQGLKATRPEGAPEIDAAKLTQMATDIASGRRPERPAPSGPPPTDGDRAATNLQSLADALGVDSDDLLEQLSAGFGTLLDQAGPYNAVQVPGGLQVDRYA